jgi:hypothetical protein
MFNHKTTLIQESYSVKRFWNGQLELKNIRPKCLPLVSNDF